MTASETPNIWLQELQDILRGSGRGLFVWHSAALHRRGLVHWLVSAARALTSGPSAVTFGVVWLLTQTGGFRRTLRLQPLEAVLESIEALGIGLLCAAIALILLRRITLATPLSETLGKLIFEGVPFSLGVALARSLLSPAPARPVSRRKLNGPSQKRHASRWPDTLVDLDATLLGAILIAFSIAPTEEIRLLAASIPPLWLLLIIAASLLLSYTIVFASGFADGSERRQRGLLLSPITETLVAYLVALLISTTMLVFFQQLTPADPWQEWLSNVLVLGLPASIGGAAGRILV
ncbi:hypothetical protein XM38_036260 [Halomicronema hongdechloris C2206]|uniref:TIGR02587 family membrane protein n=1 Tax=Halomicronema hongdechloris C2206 TaxID=1641165 RepID=A0A1Z3HQU6_9CYAN|nr:hypothetical protein XM38_036260 [Halomicronema hongdechloris C2206]